MACFVAAQFEGFPPNGSLPVQIVIEFPRSLSCFLPGMSPLQLVLIRRIGHWLFLSPHGNIG